MSMDSHPSLTKTLSEDGRLQASYRLTQTRHNCMHLMLEIVALVHLQMTLLTQLLRMEGPESSGLVGLPLHIHTHVTNLRGTLYLNH